MKTLLTVLLLLVTAACTSSSRAVRFGDRVRLLDERPCRPQVYGNDLPASYLVVGRVGAESPIDRSGLVAVLSKDACGMGADGLMELQLGTYDTVRSRFDPQTREASIEKGPKVHAATALAIKVLDATLVKAPTPAPPACEPVVVQKNQAPTPKPPAPVVVAAPAPSVADAAPAPEPPPETKAASSYAEDDLPPPPPPIFDE